MQNELDGDLVGMETGGFFMITVSVVKVHDSKRKMERQMGECF